MEEIKASVLTHVIKLVNGVKHCSIIIIIMVILSAIFPERHSPFIKIKQRCEHRIRKNKQIKSTVHDAS